MSNPRWWFQWLCYHVWMSNWVVHCLVMPRYWISDMSASLILIFNIDCSMPDAYKPSSLFTNSYICNSVLLIHIISDSVQLILMLVCIFCIFKVATSALLRITPNMFRHTRYCLILGGIIKRKSYLTIWEQVFTKIRSDTKRLSFAVNK